MSGDSGLQSPPAPEDLQKIIDQVRQIFMPHAVMKERTLSDNGNRFAHYTSAESALKIIRVETTMDAQSIMHDGFQRGAARI